METLGIIAEYNPFHNGHLYHLEESKKITGASNVICVISGNFVQRGEPALFDKWLRASMALASGADLVLELPFAFAAQSAEYFAFGAVSLLDRLGIVDAISFGSELGRIDELESIAEFLVHEDESFREKLKLNLSEGLPFPTARARAILSFIKADESVRPSEWESILSSPNNILAIEYLKALKRLGSTIMPVTIQRKSAPYHEKDISGEIASATAIRRNLYKSEIQSAMPPFSFELLARGLKEGRGPVDNNRWEAVVFSKIREMTTSELSIYPDISEGLEYKLAKAFGDSGTLDEAINKIKSKRYTYTRINRILTNIVIGFTAEDRTNFMENGGPQYIRILGMNSKGKQLLSKIKKNTSLPILSRCADMRGCCNPQVRRMFELDCRATDIYSLCLTNPLQRKSGKDFTNPVIITN